MSNKTVGGLTPSEMKQIRALKGTIQQEQVGEDITMSDAVMWAVNNELERLGDE